MIISISKEHLLVHFFFLKTAVAMKTQGLESKNTVLLLHSFTLKHHDHIYKEAEIK